MQVRVSSHFGFRKPRLLLNGRWADTVVSSGIMDRDDLLNRLSAPVSGASVLVVAMMDEVETVRRAMLHGAQGFLLKPFSEEELIESVQHLDFEGVDADAVFDLFDTTRPEIVPVGIWAKDGEASAKTSPTTRVIVLSRIARLPAHKESRRSIFTSVTISAWLLPMRSKLVRRLPIVNPEAVPAS